MQPVPVPLFLSPFPCPPCPPRSPFSLPPCLPGRCRALPQPLSTPCMHPLSPWPLLCLHPPPYPYRAWLLQGRQRRRRSIHEAAEAHGSLAPLLTPSHGPLAPFPWLTAPFACPLPMVPPPTWLLQCRQRGGGHVVEEAEAHGPLALGVVAGRPHHRQAALDRASAHSQGALCTRGEREKGTYCVLICFSIGLQRQARGTAPSRGTPPGRPARCSGHVDWAGEDEGGPRGGSRVPSAVPVFGCHAEAGGQPSSAHG